MVTYRDKKIIGLDEIVGLNRVNTLRWVEGNESVQPAIDELAADNGGTVIVAGNDRQLSEQLQVKAGVTLTTTPDVTFVHNFSPATTPALHFEAGSGAGFVRIDASQNSGVLLNQSATDGQVEIEQLEVVNAGRDEADELFGLKVVGSDTQCEQLTVEGGYHGVYIEASEVSIGSLNLVNPEIGVVLTSSQTTEIKELEIDSPVLTGLTMDACYRVGVEGTIWFNDDTYDSTTRENAVDLGTDTTVNPNKICTCDLGLHSVGGKVGLVDQNTHCDYRFHVTTASPPEITGATWDEGLELSGNGEACVYTGIYGAEVPSVVGSAASSSSDELVLLT